MKHMPYRTIAIWVTLTTAALVAGVSIFLFLNRTNAEIAAKEVSTNSIQWDAAREESEQAAEKAEENDSNNSDDSQNVAGDKENENKNDQREETAAELPKRVVHDVPFTSQAPLGNWDDPRQQDGCEEASVLMAMHWVQEKPLTSDIAVQEITAISDFEQEQYGFYRDTNVQDTARFMEAYFDFTEYEIKNLENAEQLRRILANGHIVIAPSNGRLLNNPHFTGPGPEQHMLVITGYDIEKDVFITNDPGTRYGESYEYSTDTMLAAVKEYPSGSQHQSANNDIQRILIVKR